MNLNAQKTLYHATFKENIPSILKRGLLPVSGNKVWDDCCDGVYLTPDVYEAVSFAEVGSDESDRYLDSEIVVLKIDGELLDESLFSEDINNRCEESDSIIYNGVIKIEESMVFDVDNKIYSKLSEQEMDISI